MKREAVRLIAGPVLVLAVLLAFGLSTAAAYAGEDPLAGAARSLPLWAQSKSAAVERGAAAKPPLADYDLAGGSIQALGLDDQLPGVPLAAMPVTGTLDAVDTDDIYRWNLAAGQTITVSLTGDSGTDFDLWLLAPDGSTVAYSRDNQYPELIAYRVPSNAAGTYYLPVQRWSGDGAYELSYGVDSDSELPGTMLTIPAKAVCGQLDSRSDIFDVFSVYVWAGQTFSAELDGAPGTDFDLFLVPPGTTTFWKSSATILADTFSSAGYPDSLSYPAAVTGTYYLIARTYSDTGSGWYNLSYVRALKTGTFRPALSISSSKVRVGRKVQFWGTVYPTSFSRNRMVLVQKRKDGRWVQSRWIRLDNYGKFPKMSASYTRRTTQYIRLYMPAYVDTVRGVNYKAGYSAARRIRWY